MNLNRVKATDLKLGDIVSSTPNDNCRYQVVGIDAETLFLQQLTGPTYYCSNSEGLIPFEINSHHLIFYKVCNQLKPMKKVKEFNF